MTKIFNKALLQSLVPTSVPESLNSINCSSSSQGKRNLQLLPAKQEETVNQR